MYSLHLFSFWLLFAKLSYWENSWDKYPVTALKTTMLNFAQAEHPNFHTWFKLSRWHPMFFWWFSINTTVTQLSCNYQLNIANYPSDSQLSFGKLELKKYCGHFSWCSCHKCQSKQPAKNFGYFQVKFHSKLKQDTMTHHHPHPLKRVNTCTRKVLPVFSSLYLMTQNNICISKLTIDTNQNELQLICAWMMKFEQSIYVT